MAGNLDARTVRRALSLYQQGLQAHRDELNSLNVFPVPDGDTGTNLSVTVDAVQSALADLPPDSPLPDVCRVVAHASLMGARGNAGVILSQVLRALCDKLPARNATGRDVAAALFHASHEAYRAVAKPAEGTVLTVLREAAESAESLAASGVQPGAVTTSQILEAALGAARRALERTMETLPALRDAGVVDAGGKGIVVFFDSLSAAVSGESPSEPVGPPGPIGRRERDAPARPTFAFEVQYLLEAPDEALPGLRRALEGMGDSLAVVGGGGLFNVHVHTNEPNAALDAGAAVGTPSEVSIMDLRRQVVECAGAQARSTQAGRPEGGALSAETALVAVADAPGVAEALVSLGACVIRASGGGVVPDGEIASAIESSTAPSVLVLCHDTRVRAAAAEAAAAASKEVRVLEVDSIPASLSAAAAFVPEARVDANMAAASLAAGECRSVKASAEAGDVLQTVRALARGAPDAEVVTLIAGARVSDEQAEALAGEVRSAFPALKVDTIHGGQAEPQILMGIE